MMDSTKIKTSFGALRTSCRSLTVLTTNDRARATEHLRQIGIGPVGDVVVGFGLAEIAAFDRISAVVDQEDYRFVVVSQNGRQLLCRDLERTVAHEQNVTAFRRCGQRAEQSTDRIADRPPID